MAIPSNKVRISLGASAAVALGLALWRKRKRNEDFRPVMAALDLLPNGPRSSLRKFVFQNMYQGVTRASGDLNSLMNYGYCNLEAPHNTVDLAPELEQDRFGIQLYHHLASSIHLAGLDVLEVGSGRGGGAAFVFDQHKPASLVGLDLAPAAVERANDLYGKSGLSFKAGDAEKLPFPDASFDTVLNVESSHCYPNVTTFLSEVHRVLRPGGALLLTDLRGVNDTQELRDQISSAGFSIEDEQDITANVVTALQIDSPRRAEMVRSTSPKLVRAFSSTFAGVEGSNVYNQFASRDLIYLRFTARRDQ